MTKLLQAHASITESRFVGCVSLAVVSVDLFCVGRARRSTVSSVSVLVYVLILRHQVNVTLAIPVMMPLKTILLCGPTGCCAAFADWNSPSHPNLAAAGRSWPRAAP